MAATGGGKIRTRRYHIVSKPYGKAKQQTGLISRVTDTVKSIVPSWLQKYFNNGEVPEAGDTSVQVEQNNVPTPSNCNQEAAPRPDGRDSPEPSTSNAEPSTSRASLNFQDVLSRPPLNRTHLHFSSLDSSPAFGGSLFSQPSTSTAPFPASPFAVSSNFSLVKEIKDTSSQHEDDNISTTSGFSSRASDKDVPTSKTAPLLWSPETERTQSGSQLAHTSLKKPAFNLSVFGASSSSAMNSSLLNPSQLGDSPFYPGKTTYGGAAAAKTARLRPGTPYQAPVRRQIKAKPAGAQPCGVTSATARRILQSLERMSSPLADAKRIPSTVSSPLSTSLNHSDQDVSNFQSKRRTLQPAVPPVQKLVIPAAAAVSGNRSMSFRPSLTPGSVSRPVEKVTKKTPVRRSPHIPVAAPAAVPSRSSLSYPLSSTPAAGVTGAGGGKMKRERSIRPSTKRPDDEVAEVPDLPAVSLPISNFKLPTFSFSSPPPASTFTPSTTAVPRVSQQASVSKGTNSVSTPVSVSFTFSSPIVKATAASPMSFSPSSGFTFSAPTMKTTSMSNGKLAPAISALKTARDCAEDFDGCFRPAKALKQGSVLDILKGPGFASPAQNVSETEPMKPTHSTTVNNTPVTSLSGFGEKFKPAAGSWNCSTCLLLNKSSDKKCVACQAPQPSTDSSSKSDSKPAKPPAASLNSLFAVPAGSWECDTCLVQNKPEVVKCVACDTAKPGTGVKPALTRPPVSSTPLVSYTLTTTSTTITPPGLLSFADKFKKPEGAWECDVCMLQNKAQDVKCVACQSAKPGAAAQSSQIPSSQSPVSMLTNTAPLLGFGEQFKKPEGSWECDVCCIQNKAEAKQCVACQSAKPGAKLESKGIGPQSSSTMSTSTAFTFGTSSSSNSVSSELKFGGTFSNATSTGSFKFGTASSDSAAASSGAFKFGVVPTDNTSTGSSSAEAFKFPGSSDGFKIVASSTPESSVEKKSESQTSVSGFKLGGSGAINFGSNSISTATTTASGGFAFGLSKPEEKTGLSQPFSLSASKTNAEKKNPPPSTAVSAPANVVFGKLPMTESNTAELIIEGTPQKASTTSFLFGKPEEKKDTSTPSSGFLFNAAKEADKPAPSVGFSFSKPDPPKELPNPTFGFGQNATDNAAPKPTFNFMGISSNTPASSLVPSLFGTPSSSSLAPTPAPVSTFVFGPSSSSDAPAQNFTFGQQQESQPVSAVPPTAPNPAAPFVFSSVSSNASPFPFGGAASTPASTASAPSAAPAPFGFAATTSASGFGSVQTPAFGSSQPTVPAFGSAASSFTATASAAPTFGAKPSAPSMFGQQPNSTPAFGSSTASSGQGSFQFGGAFGATGSNSSNVFNFGGGSGATAAASPAMSAQPAAPGGSFSFSQPLAFNIGSAKSSTPAPTGQHGIAGRKIKTAVRRRK